MQCRAGALSFLQPVSKAAVAAFRETEAREGEGLDQEPLLMLGLNPGLT